MYIWKLLRVSFVLFFLTSLVYASTYFSYPGFHVSPEGLMLTNWEISGPAIGPSPQLNHPVGKPVEATFTLTNVTDQPLLLNKMYVACRYSPKAEETGKVVSKDFGFLQNVLLEPGASKTLHASLVLNKVGSWRFWPSYEVGGKKGPLRWHDFIVRVEAHLSTANFSGGRQVLGGPFISPDGLKISNFILSTPKNPKVGAFAVVDYDITNVSGKPITLAPDGLYVSARANLPTVIEDFGFKSLQKITLKPGQTLHVHAGRKMDKPGLWFFWAGYKILGGNTVPFKWHDLDVDVQQ